MKRILIIKPSSMGDVLHAFPAVAALLEEKNVIVDWVIHPAFEELLDYLGLNGRRILFKRKELGKFTTFFGELRRLCSALRAERYDAVLDLQGLLRSGLLGLLARTPLRCGLKEPKEKLAGLCYNKKLHWKKETSHALEKNCDLVSDFLGGKKVGSSYTLPAVEKYVKAVDTLFQKEGLAPKAEFIAMAPGTRWETKQWDEANFVKSALLIAEKLPGKPFVLLGSPGEKALCSGIAAALEGKVNCADLCGKTSMGELLEVIRRAGVLICNDSGPMHAAAAAGTPLTAFFAPTDPALTGPYGKNCLVLQPDLECLHCFKKQCSKRMCHQAITPEMMAGKVLELLQQERVSK